MNLIKRILDYSYHARDVRVLDPATGKPVPRAGDPSIWIRAGAAMMNAGWAKRNFLKYIYAITGPLAAWLSAHGGGEQSAAIAAWVVTGVTFAFDRLTSWLNEQATMKIPPRVGAPTAEQERESIEAYKGMQPPLPFTSDSGTTTTRSAMFQAIIAKPTSPADDDAALLEFRQRLRPLAPVPVIPKGDFAVESWDRDNGEPTVTYYETKFQAIAFRDAQRLNHVRANLL